MFLEKSYTKCVGEASLRPFYKNSKLSISLDRRSEESYLFTRCKKSLFPRCKIFSLLFAKVESFFPTF